MRKLINKLRIKIRMISNCFLPCFPDGFCYFPTVHPITFGRDTHSRRIPNLSLSLPRLVHLGNSLSHFLIILTKCGAIRLLSSSGGLEINKMSHFLGAAILFPIIAIA